MHTCAYMHTHVLYRQRYAHTCICRQTHVVYACKRILKPTFSPVKMDTHVYILMCKNTWTEIPTFSRVITHTHTHAYT